MPTKKTANGNFNGNHNHGTNLKYKICISGAAETGHCAPGALEKTEELGRLIAERGMILVTGATTGAPLWAAKGAKQAGGMVIGISPAATKIQHVKSYRLPTEYHDLIMYTGFGYSGRNLLLTRSSDAVLTVCGRIGTLNEFTDAFEDQRVQGVLTGTGGTADMLQEVLDKSHRGYGKVVFESDPEKLLDKVVTLIEAEEREIE
ncbi:MAG: LOG family protein [Candidatus Liptonbacteria bacterium]|nr:LOG family protein [Candidatus Liptonbacteria bacterium]MBI3114758.1 LOG family protein [Candidatus Harrisonbacteria bacterium]